MLDGHGTRVCALDAVHAAPHRMPSLGFSPALVRGSKKRVADVFDAADALAYGIAARTDEAIRRFEQTGLSV